MNLRTVMAGFNLQFWTIVCEGLIMGLLNILSTVSINKYGPEKSMRLAETCQAALGKGQFAHGLDRLNRAWPWKQGCGGRPKDAVCKKCGAKTTTNGWHNAVKGHQ